MSDLWNEDSVETTDVPMASGSSNQSEMVEQASVASDTPLPPVNNVDADGSFQYVPPQNVPMYQAPAPQRYPSAVQQPAFQPPVTATEPPKEGKSRGWIVVVAILAALAVLISCMTLAFHWIDQVTNDAPSKGNVEDTTDLSDVEDTDALSNQSKPSATTPPVVPEGAYGDGGYTTEYIVSKNYDSAVVLSMYMNMEAFPYYQSGGLQQVGAASGIVWTADGYIITNCHCVVDEETGKKYDRIDVTTYDGTIYKDAQVIGADQSTDLAVIKVDATNLQPAEFGDSDQLAVGARVVALGNAAGLSWTATQGIVSAKARDVYEDTGYAIRCLQVDAAINSGNSGGPLFNKYGQVIAVNSAKIAASGYEGLGFAIPINEAWPVLESLKQNGYVTGRVSLGINGDSYDDGYYQGYYINSILDPTGWQNTDTEKWEYSRYEGRWTVIVAVDDVEVVDYGTLRAALAKYEVGDTVTLKLLHYDRYANDVTTHYVKVTLKEQTAN